jgi:hypothetical protein
MRECIMSDYSTSIGLYSILERSENGITLYYDRYEHEVGDIVQLKQETWDWYLNPYTQFGEEKITKTNNMLFVVTYKGMAVETTDGGKFRDKRIYYKVVSLEDPSIILDLVRYDELTPLKVNKVNKD